MGAKRKKKKNYQIKMFTENNNTNNNAEIEKILLESLQFANFLILHGRPVDTAEIIAKRFLNEMDMLSRRVVKQQAKQKQRTTTAPDSKNEISSSSSPTSSSSSSAVKNYTPSELAEFLRKEREKILVSLAEQVEEMSKSTEEKRLTSKAEKATGTILNAKKGLSVTV